MKKTFALFIVFLGLIGITTSVVIDNKLSCYAASNTYFNGVDISGRNYKEIEDIINEKIASMENEKIVFYSNGLEKTFSMKEVGVTYYADNILNEIFETQDLGLIDSLKFLSSRTDNPSEYTLTASIDKEKLRKKIAENFETMVSSADGVKLTKVDSKVKLEYGKEGVAIDFEKLYKEVEKTLSENTKVLIPTKKVKSVLDEDYYNKFFDNHLTKPLKYPIDAKVNIKNGQIVFSEEVSGLTADKNKLLETVKTAIDKGLTEVLIPTKPLLAQKTKAALEQAMNGVKDNIGSFTTNFSTDNGNRNTNIRLSAEAINGTFLAPNEVFDFHQVVGYTSSDKGYKEAGAYENGKVVQSLGGGICQVSTTLYNAALYANLEIIERSNHSMPVGYVPPSRDAAVSWGGKNLRFKNNTGSYIYITAETTKNSITFNIFGVDDGTKVELTSSVTERINSTVQKVLDTSLPAGTEKVVQSGSNGYRSTASKIVTKNGEVISKTVLSNDYYAPINKIVKYNTEKKPAPVVEVAPPSKPQKEEIDAEKNVDIILEQVIQNYEVDSSIAE